MEGQAMTSGDIASVLILIGLCVTIMMLYFGSNWHKAKMKMLEIEALRIQKANLQAEVNVAIEEKMTQYKERMQVLEEIVTSRNYDLDERITRIK